MLRLAKISFLLMIFSLPFMRHHVSLGGLHVTATDLLFLVSAGSWTAALLSGRTVFRWHSFYWLLAFYFAAMAVSAIFSTEPGRSWFKLMTQAYLLALPVLTYNLIRSVADIQQSFRWWMAATFIVATLGMVTLLLFYSGIDRAWLAYPLHHFGTLPPGNYPRLELTFDYPAMLCNYLTLSLMILLIMHRLRWIGTAPFSFLLIAICFSALFSLTPGLGGIPLALGIWAWLHFRDSARFAARMILATGILAAFMFVLSAVVAPMMHPTASFMIHIPGLDQPLAPSARLMFWIESVRNFSLSPLIGHGIGTDAIRVQFMNPSNSLSTNTDAHNVFLNIAVQCGSIGLCALLLLIVYIARRMRPMSFGASDKDIIRLGLGFAFLNAFAYQGLTGSYEDARHLWILLGFFLTSLAPRDESRTGPMPTAGDAEQP